MSKVKFRLAILGLMMAFCVAAPNSARAHEVDVCFCILTYDSKGDLRHPEDVPFVSVFDGLQKVIPEQARFEGFDPELVDNNRVRMSIDPFENSDVSVTGVNICDFGNEFNEIAEAVYQSALPKPASVYGLPPTGTEIQLLDIATLGAAGNLAVIALSGDDDGTVETDGIIPLGQGTVAVSN